MKDVYERGIIIKSKIIINKPLFIFHIVLAGLAVTCLFLIFLDPQNSIVYSEIVQFLFFLLFLIRSIYFIKINNYKLGLLSFLVVIVYIGLGILKVLLHKNII